MTTGGTPDMQALLQQAQQMQQQLTDAQERLAQAQVTGDAGGGLVTATVSGTGELLGLEIRAGAVGEAEVSDDDLETLQDLVLAAVRAASSNAAEEQAREMGPLTGGLGGLGLPGM